MVESLNSHSTAVMEREQLLHARVVRNPNNIASDMGEEKVLLSVENGKYYNLGIMGGQIWDLIQEPIAVLGLIDLLTEQFEVDRITCEEQLLPFMFHLLEERLIHIIE